jgi:transcriptional regulator GlxA family with amidase domain
VSLLATAEADATTATTPAEELALRLPPRSQRPRRCRKVSARPPRATRRVIDALRRIEAAADRDLALADLARERR